MSLSVWLISAGVIGVCGFIFKKTVSNDAKNDFRLRDILTSDSPYEEEAETAPQDITKPKFFNEIEQDNSLEKETVATKTTYDQPKNEPKESYNYSAYSTKTHESTKTKQEEKPNYQYDNEPVYYEKINDDACEPDYNTEENYEEEYNTSKNINYDDYKDEEPKFVPPKNTKSSSNNLFNLVKTFWRGITFSVGMLICLYAFNRVVAQAQTSNDAILYSIWLLIGVILIK